MEDIKLEIKFVSQIEGKFLVPSYQRGYRWGEAEVLRLLDDIMENGENNYCLQPIVVKKTNDKYELIDGQQRLTTLYLIYYFLKVGSGGFFKNEKFSLDYVTRPGSAAFLSNLDVSIKDTNIDYYFIYQAYEVVERWFNSKENIQGMMSDFNRYFDKYVKVIWYEVNDTIDPIALFTRLNIGKIQLTSAELVKAMFLNSVSSENKNIKDANSRKRLDLAKREEIAFQWDNIEKDLHDEKLWFFLTNDSASNYQTRIDLLLDMIARKPVKTKDKYFTFFAFDAMRETSNLVKTWQKIQNSFLTLKDWFENHELYHKIGYLIASETLTLNEIFYVSENKTKEDFLNELNRIIKESIKTKKDYSEMSYENAADYNNLKRLLLLFNVESVSQNGEQTQWFPFDKFKFDHSKKNSWSLEHIHAQQSEGLKTQEGWREWLELHLDSIKTLNNDENLVLQNDIEYVLNQKEITRDKFKELQERVFSVLSTKGNVEYLHLLSNMALLNTSDNSALNNSAFDVKRNEIIKMDKSGKFIPFCTKMVFLKYYTPSNKSQLHFWGEADRIAYIDDINKVLVSYLEKKIKLFNDEGAEDGHTSI